MIIQANAACKLDDIDENSIDCIITDPPYGYSFMGKDWDKKVVGAEIWKKCLKVLKPGSFALVMSAPRQDVLARMILNLTDAGFIMDFSSIKWAYAVGFPKAGNASKLADRKLGKKRQQIPATGGLHNNDVFNDDDWSKIGQSNPTMDSNRPASSQAKKLDGSYLGFQPKPAVEEILVCMKPLSEKSYIDQAIKDGKGISWMNDCRIPYTSESDKENTRYGSKTPDHVYGDYGLRPKNRIASQIGRFPANLLVSDDALNDGKIRNDKPHFSNNKIQGGHGYGFKAYPRYIYTDSGSFSRYFDLDKWQSQFIIEEKPSRTEKESGLHPDMTSLAEFCEFEVADGVFAVQTNDGRQKPPDNAFQRGQTIRLNSHPTVKPISLMAYLVTMFSRENDTILDPFAGSGTTGIAAGLLARKFTGIEQDHHSCVIAHRRLTYWKNKTFEKVQKIKKAEEKRHQMTLEVFE